MEYIFLFLLGWIVLCSPALIYAMVANSRRRRDLLLLDEKISALTRALDALEHRARMAAQPAAQPASTPVSAQPAQAPEIKILPTPSIAKPAAPPVVAAPPMPPKPVPATVEKLPAPIAKPITPPAVPVAPPATRQEMPYAQAPEVSKPVAPPPPPPIVKQPAPMQASASYRAGQPAIPGMSAPSRSAAPAGGPTFSALPAEAVKAKKQSLEYSLGTNWLPKLGIVILVVGVGFLVGHAWGQFAPALRVLILYAGGLALLAGGVFLERREHFRVLGRGLIGGGWAVLALVTYAIANLRPVLVLPSKSVDLFLLMALVGAMVGHTLKYNSQLVTGTAFLLGFISIGMNPVPPYNLVAGAMVITGLTVIVLRYGWFELEIFGILASYINHFLWLYPIVEPMAGHKHQFPDFWPSVALLGFYWAVFRVSYLLRKPLDKEQESVSTIAGLVNPILLLAVMKYQSFHPEMAFYALLVLGAVEFTLGQLGAARRRIAPFYVLSSLGAAMMVASVPFKYSGHSLEMLWLAGGEAFLLAGIFTRERLFRGFGIIVSLLVAFYTMSVRMPAMLQEIVNGQPHYHAQFSLVLAIIALALYANSHLTRRFWPDLFRDDLEQGTLPIFSFVASVFTVAAVYAFFSDKTVPIVLALVVTALSLMGKGSLQEFMYEAHWITVVVMVQTIVSTRTLETAWHGISERILIVAPVAALLYLSSRFVRLSATLGKEIAVPAYAVFASTLLALLMWFQAPVWAVTLWWIALALALSLAGQALKRVDLKWQAFVLMLLAFSRSLAVNLDLTATYHHLTYRLITVSLAAMGIYLLARWSPLTYIRPAYTVAGTFLLALVAANEAPEPWIAVAWMGLALVLALAARLWKDRALLWQTHVLSALAAGWTFYANFNVQYRGTRVQLETVGIAVALLYVLVWLTDIDRLIEDERICQAYAWAASLLLSWLAWFQLHPENVSLAWGILGLALFEIPEIFSLLGVDLRRFAASWKAQAYVALAGSFVHIYYGNFNTRAAGNFLQVTLDPRVLTVAMLAPIYFYVYVRAHAESGGTSPSGSIAAARPLRISAEYLVASLGTATIASLVRFEVDPEAVVVGYAAIVVLLLVVAWRARQQLFIYQALAMLGVTAFRISMHNFYHLHEAFSFSLAGAGWAIALLAIAVPIAMLARKTIPESTRPGWIHSFVRHPEQPMFFVPVVLLAVLLYLKMPGGMITLSWGLEGVLVFLLALWARERSFRLAGLGLLLLCVGKILFYDAWQLSDPTARYMTLIGVGAILLVVSYLYGKNREALREYL